jgi:hypothetical protein
MSPIRPNLVALILRSVNAHSHEKGDPWTDPKISKVWRALSEYKLLLKFLTNVHHFEHFQRFWSIFINFDHFSSLLTTFHRF